MATTIKTIEIATLMHTALRAVVSDDVYVYAFGVKTDNEGNPDAQAIKISRKCPMVEIRPSERVPQRHDSVLRSYPIRLRVITNGPDDQFQVDLCTISQAVSEWLCSSPALAMTLSEFDALVIEGAPEMGTGGNSDTLQYQEWQLTIKTRDTA